MNLCHGIQRCFRRARIIAGGQVIEAIDDFNSLSLMLTALKPEEKLMIAAEGFGSFDDRYPSAGDDTRKTYRTQDCDKSGVVWQSRRVLFKPMFGLLNQEKLIPLRYCPLQIELELVTNGADAVYVNMAGADEKYTFNWDVSDIQCKLDLLELDRALSNGYT